jgi:hypothetical protein
MGDVQYDQNMAMKDMSRALQVLQHENNNMRQAFERLQVGALPAPQNPGGAVNQQVLQPVPEPIRDPRISLPDKFDRTQSEF